MRWMVLACMCITLLYLSSSANAQTITEYGESWDRRCEGSLCSLTLYSGPVNYWNGNAYEPINTTAYYCNRDGYEWCIDKAPYQLYYRAHSNWGDGIKYCVNLTGEQKCVTYQSQDYSYRDVYGSQDYISSIQDKVGSVNGSTMTFSDTYPSTDLQYTAYNGMLKELYTIKALPKQPAAYLTAPITLDFGGYLKFGKLNMYVDDKLVTGTNFVTSSKIEFRDGGTTLFYLPEPYAYDSAGNRTPIQYEVKKSGNQIWFYVRTPFTWLNDSSRVYPVYVDPTITLITANSENLEDAYVLNTSASTNFGTSQYLIAATATSKWNSYIKYNISLIPEDVNITNVNFWLYGNSSSPGITEIRHCYNQTWSEDKITWNDQPCNKTFNSTLCNATRIDNGTNGGSSWAAKRFTVTHAVKSEYESGNSNVSFFINGSKDEAFFSTKENIQKPYLYITYTYAYEPRWDNPINSTITEYNPNTAFTINITWNLSTGSTGTISPVYIEGNWSGANVNYTIDNGTWGPNIWNFTTTTVPAGLWKWRSWANGTGTRWNHSDWVVFRIGKNTTNYQHINISYDGSDNIDTNMSTTSDKTITITGYFSFANTGTAALWMNDHTYTNGISQTWGTGTYYIRTNTSGNTNYSANTTGILRQLIITQPPGGGGGGGSGASQPLVYSIYNAIPKTGFTGYGIPGKPIPTNFTLQIYNGNTTQLFSVTFEFDDGTEYCELLDYPRIATLPNGIANFRFQCTAPNGTAEGKLILKTDTGSTDSRNIKLYGLTGPFADLTITLMLFVSGDFLGAVLYPITAFGFMLPAALWLIIILIVAGVIWKGFGSL